MKHIYLKTIFAALLLLCSSMASAHDFEVNGIFYNITDATAKTVEVTYKGNSYSEYNEYSGSVIIPSTVTYNSTVYDVTSIRGEAFEDCTGLASIEIPGSVTSIGDWAFEDCTGLTSITIPNSVASIGDEAFYGCTGLTAVHINDLAAWCRIYFSDDYSNPLLYGNNIYVNGELVTHLVIPNSVTTIGDYAFYDCDGITSVTIPNSVTNIGYYAFYHCSGLTSVTIGNSVTSIGYCAFQHCYNLKTVYNLSSLSLSAGSYSYGYVAYYADEVINAPNGPYIFDVIDGVNTLCEYIGNGGDIVLPEDCNGENYVIGSNVFRNNTAITSVTIPDGVTSIGNTAFYYCQNLTSVKLGKNVTTLGDFAFQYCTSLNDISLPNSLQAIGKASLSHCGFTNVVIPNKVKTIGDYAFDYCENLAQVTIGNCVTGIGHYAFDGCENLKTVYNFSSLNIVKDSTDNGYVAYYADKVINAPYGHIEGDFVFERKGNFTTADGLPGTVTGSNHIWESPVINSSTNRVRITVLATNGGSNKYYYEGYPIVALGELEFYDGNGNKINYTASNVTTNSLEGTEGSLAALCDGNYSTFYHSTWSGTGTVPTDYVYIDIEFPQTVDAFKFKMVGRNTKSLVPTEIQVTPGKYSLVAYVGNDTALVLPENCNGENYTIGADAFSENTAITSIEIPNSVTSIGYGAFRACTGLTSVTIGNSVTAIDEWAFSYCDGLTSVTIPNSVTSIGFSAFFRCTGLTSVTIPNSVTSIGNSAFSGCTGLTSVEIPNSVTSIGYQAFEDCTGLASITVNSGNSVYDSREGCNAIIETATNTLIAGCKNTIIQGSVTSIGYYAFKGCTGLTSIEIPSSVTDIRESTFEDCTGLTSITIPNSITSIGNYAFDDCSGLTEVYVKAKTPPTIDSSTFDNYSVTLYVPAGAKDAYQAADYWKNFTNIVEMEPDALPGDVNEDGRVSVADITTVVDAILNESSDTAYDVNGDSRVSVADITTIVDIILNEGASEASNAPARVATRSTSALSLYIDPFEINAGEVKDILVNLSNPGTEITAVEFDLFLPEGLEVLSDEYGYYLSPGSRTPKRVPHSVSGDLMSSGAIHVICYHNSQLAFTGEDGDVVAITIKAADDLEPGNYTIELKNVELVNPADPKNGFFISDNNTVVTDIENIEAEEKGTTVIYDLSGRKVAEPAKGGIYIINGKKVVVNK